MKLDDTIDDLSISVDKICRTVDRLRAQRARLLEALRNQYCVQCRGKIGDPKQHDESCDCDEARAAIKEATGE